MHARHCPSENHGTAQSLPPGTVPRIFKDKEQCEGYQTSKDRNNHRAHQIREFIRGAVVSDGSISQVVHAGNGSSREKPGKHDSPPLNSNISTDAQECEDEHEDGDQQRHDGQGGGVGDLEGFLAVKHVNGSIADEVLSETC